jgi:hypothetical protein
MISDSLEIKSSIASAKGTLAFSGETHCNRFLPGAMPSSTNCCKFSFGNNSSKP